MAIKSTLISTVNGFITSIVTVAKVRSALLEMINNFYPTVITETFLSTNVITEKNTINTDLGYGVFIHKQGRTVFINGYVRNNSASIVNDFFFKIVGSEYIPVEMDISPLGIYVCNTNDSTSNLFLHTSDDNKIKGILPANTEIYFSLSYPTLN